MEVDWIIKSGKAEIELRPENEQERIFLNFISDFKQFDSSLFRSKSYCRNDHWNTIASLRITLEPKEQDDKR